MTDIEGFLTIYGHSDNLLNNNRTYSTFKTLHVFFEREGERVHYASRSLTSGSVRIVRSCFLDVTTILSLLSLLFSVYQCYQGQDLVA